VDLNNFIIDKMRQVGKVGFGCVDIVSTPFNYFHMYKYYDGFINYAPVATVYRPLDDISSPNDIYIKRLEICDVD
jgi:hypothetical protein